MFSPSPIIFGLSVGFIGYVLFLYPVILAVISRLRAKPVTRRFEPRSVTVLLAVRNGEVWLGKKLESLLAMDYPRELLTILVLSDGSTDNTVAIAEQFSDSGVQVLSLPPGGKAAALNAGLAVAQGEILFFTDVRQLLDTACLSNLVACFAQPEVGVVSGELMLRKSERNEEQNIGLYWQYEKWIRKQLSSIDSVMGATGAVYAMRRSLARPLPPETLLDDMYLPLGAFFSGYRVLFEERAHAYDVPASLKTEFQRKVRTQAGVYQIIRFYPSLLGPRNRMWLHFMSHKVGRLLLPFALLAVGISSIWLPAPLAGVALIGQAGFYTLAILDLWLPERMPLKRLTSPIRTFVTLMMAAFCALAIVFVDAQTLWKTPGQRR